MINVLIYTYSVINLLQQCSFFIKKKLALRNSQTALFPLELLISFKLKESRSLPPAQKIHWIKVCMKLSFGTKLANRTFSNSRIRVIIYGWNLSKFFRKLISNLDKVHPTSQESSEKWQASYKAFRRFTETFTSLFLYHFYLRWSLGKLYSDFWKIILKV